MAALQLFKHASQCHVLNCVLSCVWCKKELPPPGSSGTLWGCSGTLWGRSGALAALWGLCGHFGDGWMVLMMVVVMVMTMTKIFAFHFYIFKLPINRLRGRYVTFLEGF